MIYCERCELCGNRWQRIPLTILTRDSETARNNRALLSSTIHTVKIKTKKRPVEMERLFLPSRAREHDNAGFATAESPLGMLDVQYKNGAQPGRLRRASGGPGDLRGCGREHCSHRGERDPVPSNAQGQLKCVDQKSDL